MKLPLTDVDVLYKTWSRLYLIGDFEVVLKNRRLRRALMAMSSTFDKLEAMHQRRDKDQLH